MKPTDFARHLTKYLTIYLPGQRGISKNTIQSYTDTFRLLLIYCRDKLGRKPEKMTLEHFDSGLITGFLDWLETERNNSVATRNQRLSGIQAFCRYVMNEAPEQLALLQKNLSVSRKKYAKPQIGYLSVEETTAILEKPNTMTLSGRRDLALLTLLYDSGARVSELVGLKVRDLRLDKYPIITLHGKGGKSRQVPLMKKTSILLSQYLAENHLDRPGHLDFHLFTNRQRKPLTGAGVTYILQKYANRKDITPHIMRHTKAMHLLQAGVNIVYIRDILGHSSIETTNIYARADTEMKRKALESVADEITPNVPDWKSDNALMEWLNSLGS